QCLLCVVCKKIFSVRSMPEHFTSMHLESRCLQLARCVSTQCNEKPDLCRDMHSTTYVTAHLLKREIEHELVVPNKMCRHRHSAQCMYDELMEMCVYLGVVDEKGVSFSEDKDQQKRLDAFLHSPNPVIDFDPD
ncbi:hypothetical protein PENTCL1PPCAC_13409, partial [Pristionchus entomophagus]